MSNLIITIDGPAGSGKSTIAKMLADKLGVGFLDTGAMYRAVTLTAVKAGFDMTDSEVMLRFISRCRFSFDLVDGVMRVKVNSADITDKIRDPEITAQVHHIASNPDIREKLVQMQRDFAYRQGSIVTEGRDQGTVAFPYADFKFFLNATAEERAKRRRDQLLESGIDKPVEEILKAIKARDEKDENRSTGRLTPAEDAVVIDTTKLSIDEVLDEMLCRIKAKD